MSLSSTAVLYVDMPCFPGLNKATISQESQGLANILGLSLRGSGQRIRMVLCTRFNARIVGQISNTRIFVSNEWILKVFHENKCFHYIGKFH